MVIVEKYWHFILFCLAILYALLFESSIFEASILCSGVLCVALVAKGNVWNYLIGMYNTIAYAYVAFNEHLYGEFGLYILFFVPTNIIGFFMWKKTTTSHTVNSRSLTLKKRTFLFVSVIALTVALALILSLVPNQNNPYLDSYITVTSIVATLLMMRRYSEQWILYILLNTVSIILWAFRYANGSEIALSMMGMFAIFWINACFGWYMWQVKLKEKEHESRTDIG